MANVICLKFKKEIGSFCEKFQLDDEEEYLVKINITGCYLQEIGIVLKWKKRSDLFIRTKIFSDASNCTYQKRILVTEGKYASMNASLSLSNCNNVLLISIAKYRQLKSCESSLPYFNSEYQTSVKHVTVEPLVGEKREHLSKDMKNLLQTGYLSDIVLSDETNEIRAHKLILSARSPVFAKMLQHKMRESLENIIIIKDIPIDVLKKLLEFLYTGEVETKDMKMAINLYVAGEKYDIKDLKEICSQMLMKVDLDNVIDIIILADLHHDEPLKQAALTFIHRHFLQVRAIESWSDFLAENRDLAVEVLNYVLERKT